MLHFLLYSWDYFAEYDFTNKTCDRFIEYDAPEYEAS